jgi:hypothetical protein
MDSGVSKWQVKGICSLTEKGADIFVRHNKQNNAALMKCCFGQS